VKVYGPAHADRQSPRYDLVVNVDSLTELGRKVAAQYVDWICDKTPRFLSINHEANRFTVRELLAGRAGVAAERHPYWMRNGFVEEVFTLPSA